MIQPLRIILVAGARPNFMKIAPLMEAFSNHPLIEPILVHTGQHYDEKMSDLFFRQLGIPRPDINLDVRSGSHARQTAAIMTAFEPIVEERKPDAILVVGDVNSTVACCLVGSKMGVPLIHVEAGLRSFDRGMPEEINRLVTDCLSDMLFCTEQSGVENLLKEGTAPAKIHMVGNVMIDTLIKNQEKAARSTIIEDLGLTGRDFALVTLHRPSNVDHAETMEGLTRVLEHVQRRIPVVFPIHPRTRARLAEHGLQERFQSMENLISIEPAGYLDFLKLMSASRIVLSDSGGIQEETTILRVPCLTLRENTERPVTCEVGSNYLVGVCPDKIIHVFESVMNGSARQPQIPPLWDGNAAERIAAIIVETLCSKRQERSTIEPTTMAGAA